MVPTQVLVSYRAAGFNLAGRGMGPNSPAMRPLTHAAELLKVSPPDDTDQPILFRSWRG